jgi:hypothetical protein
MGEHLGQTSGLTRREGRRIRTKQQGPETKHALLKASFLTVRAGPSFLIQMDDARYGDYE